MLHINIIGAVLALIFGAVLYFTIITGATDDMTKATTSYNGTKTTADTLPKAKADLEKAKKDKIAAETAYAVYEKQYMPVIGYTSDRLTTMMRVFWPNNGRSWPERYRKLFANWMASQQKKFGIQWDNKEVTAMGPYGPNPNTIDAGSPGEGLGENLHYRYAMQVRAKTIQAIQRHFADWSNIRNAGVPVASNLQITGNSPNLTATYDLAMTLILHEKIPPADGRLGGGGGNAGGGGGFPGGGGPPPGMTGSGGGGGPAMGGSGGGGGKPGGGGKMGAF